MNWRMKYITSVYLTFVFCMKIGQNIMKTLYLIWSTLCISVGCVLYENWTKYDDNPALKLKRYVYTVGCVLYENWTTYIDDPVLELKNYVTMCISVGCVLYENRTTYNNDPVLELKNYVYVCGLYSVWKFDKIQWWSCPWTEELCHYV